MEDEFPAFIVGELVFYDSLVINRKRHLFALARNLKFYQFCQKQLVNSIDLSGSCLKEVYQHLIAYKGPNRKWFDVNNARKKESVYAHGSIENSNLPSTASGDCTSFSNDRITFGKYVYRNFDLHTLYLLIQCWNKLLVINLTDFTLATEIDGVNSFRIIHGKEKFEAKMEIKFENGNYTCTDFQQHENFTNFNQNINDKNSLKQLLERVRCAKAELQVHKSTTHKEFDSLRDQETFGCNYVRSDQLEEKPLISRCGDVWLRFVASDTIVIGIPLVNNCAENCLTTIKNLKPILKMNDALSENIIYNYRMYQLRMKFEDLETAEIFFQTEEEELNNIKSIWEKCELPKLAPSSFAVLLVAIHTSRLLLLENCPLLLYYEVEKEHPQAQIYPTKTAIFEQHILLTNFNVRNILNNQQKYELSFEFPSFHQDFLATAMMNKESVLHIEFETKSDALLFEHLFTKKFNFNTVSRQPRETNLMENNGNHNQVISSIYFNKIITSPWFGSMALKIITPDEHEDTIQRWKLYLYNKEKSFICLKLLFNDLILENCSIKSINYIRKNLNSFPVVKNALGDEIESLLLLKDCIDDARKISIFKELMKKQFGSDLLFITN